MFIENVLLLFLPVGHSEVLAGILRKTPCGLIFSTGTADVERLTRGFRGCARKSRDTILTSK